MNGHQPWELLQASSSNMSHTNPDTSNTIDRNGFLMACTSIMPCTSTSASVPVQRTITFAEKLPQSSVLGHSSRFFQQDARALTRVSGYCPSCILPTLSHPCGGAAQQKREPSPMYRGATNIAHPHPFTHPPIHTDARTIQLEVVPKEHILTTAYHPIVPKRRGGTVATLHKRKLGLFMARRMTENTLYLYSGRS